MDLLVVSLQPLEEKLPVPPSVGDVHKLPTANHQRSVLSRLCPGRDREGTVSSVPPAVPDSQCGLSLPARCLFCAPFLGSGSKSMCVRMHVCTHVRVCDGGGGGGGVFMMRVSCA